MPRFTVILVESVSYVVEVEADSVQSAGEIATEKWEESQDPTHDFCGQGNGVEVEAVERIEADAEAPATRYAFTADSCPSKHWNDGTDICRDCGVNLN